MDVPLIKVGIMAEKKIIFTLEGDYVLDHLSTPITGEWEARKVDSGICLESGNRKWLCQESLRLTPINPKKTNFVLRSVTIGKSFHWERKENQLFKGSLSFIRDDDKIHAINTLSIEDYLLSVISSEMSANCSLPFLKAHSVISRSWLLAQIRKNKDLQTADQKYQTIFRSDEKLIRWYDREDHIHFDVCADDHCQRYQGITRIAPSIIEKAVRETTGEVLISDDMICDARFSKCCGGVTELFENVWEPANHPYLQMVVDNNSDPDDFISDLKQEDEAVKWITGNPDAFCNCSNKDILQQVLNDYDRETKDFFRWKVVYTQKELSELVKSKTGIDFGSIVDLNPVERGVSGRLIQLKITGTKRTMTIGKELEIRKTLSASHLYSSAFIIEKQPTEGSINFVLHGAGWGHGVGLCQIGAAVMGTKGFAYHEILSHYFPGANLLQMY